MKHRIPWSFDEDQYILRIYNNSNGGFPTYASEAAELNRQFHGGKSIRSVSALRRRECKLLSPK